MAPVRATISTAFILASIGFALAQEAGQQSPQQSRTPALSAPGTGGITGNLGPPGPRFLVTLKNFEAIDETNWDFWGSDEAVFIVRTETYQMETREFDNLNSNSTVHPFDSDANCAVPAEDAGPKDGKWTCKPAGGAAPIIFSVEAWEVDPNVEAIWGYFCIKPGTSDLFSRDRTFCTEDSNYSVLIGQAGVTLDLPYLMSRLGQVGQTFDQNVVLEGGCYKAPSADYQVPLCKPDDTEPRYNVNFTVTRVANSPGSGGVVVDP